MDYSYAEAGKIALALLEFDENGNRDEIHLTASFDVQAGEDQSESINFDIPTTLVPSANLDQGHYTY